MTFLSPARSAEHASEFVNPFIGTAGGGNTFPGAVRPWGMVSVSPHTALSSPSGYQDDSRWLYGLGHVHLSGTGCADLGNVVIIPTRGPVRTDPSEYRCRLSHQRASPGFYAAELPDLGLQLEATATDRTGLTRFRSSLNQGLTIMIDVGRSLSLQGGGTLRIVDSLEVEGFSIGGGFCGESNRHIVYFVARFSSPARKHGIWVSNRITHDDTAAVADSSLGAWFQFSMRRGETLSIAVGISYVSTTNARSNLEAENHGRTFEEVHQEARAAWDSVLGRFRITSSSKDDCVKFYTALYHALIHPSTISDVNGEFPTMGRKSVGRYDHRRRYSVFSLWDTYRTVHPLLTLAYPEKESEIVKTMLDMFRESGWLPKWELAGNETYMMVGDPAAIVVADTYLKGVRDFDTLLAYEAISKAAATFAPGAEAARPGYSDFLSLGYIPADQDTTREWWVWGPVSTTLEYCLADWTTARVAEAMGRKTESMEFYRRSLFYRNLYDSTTGFLRPRRRDGSWLTPFGPFALEGSGNWSGSGGPGYVEGNAWTYTWFVPHDIAGLSGLFGGSEACTAKLEQVFQNGQFTVTNEPDLAYPFLFTYFPGMEHRTCEIVDSLRERRFGVGAAGLPGNDDAGAISAWFVFSALGLYPACPGSNEYRLGSPLFNEVSILPAGEAGARIIIRTAGSQQARKLRSAPSVSWNGRRLESASIGHAELVQGGTLVFVYGND